MVVLGAILADGRAIFVLRCLHVCKSFFHIPAGAILGPSWDASWTHLGPVSSPLPIIFAGLGANLAHLGAILGHLGAIFGQLGAMYPPFTKMHTKIKEYTLFFTRFWGSLGPILGSLSAIFAPSWGSPGNARGTFTIEPVRLFKQQ